MARLPRLELAGHAHLVLLLALPGPSLFVDAGDRQQFLNALTAAANEHTCRLHAWALLETEVRLLLTPEQAPALGRCLQALGRRYVSARHHKQGLGGPMWKGRFRSAVLEPGATVLEALVWVDGASDEAGRSSAAHRLGASPQPGLVDPIEYWQLGNTPFDREAAYSALLANGLGAPRAAWLRQAALGGWAAGGTVFAQALSARTQRPARPRQAGRPRKPG